MLNSNWKFHFENGFLFKIQFFYWMYTTNLCCEITLAMQKFLDLKAISFYYHLVGPQIFEIVKYNEFKNRNFENLKKAWKVFISMWNGLILKWKVFSLNEKVLFSNEKCVLKMKRFFCHEMRMKRFFKWKGFWVFLKSRNEMKMKRKGFRATLRKLVPLQKYVGH